MPCRSQGGEDARVAAIRHARSTNTPERGAGSRVGLPIALTRDARWGIAIGWASQPEPLMEVDADAELRVASVAKLLLLAACAGAIESGELDPRQLLDRRSVSSVADSGIWQHLDQEALSVHDCATLIGVASDNLATNVLLDALGLDRVRAEAAALDVEGVRLHDRVRDERTPSDPATLGTATARGLFELVRRIANGTLGGAGVSARVGGWLANSVDLSMVASAFHLDPLAHGTSADATLINKTGTDAGVRADVGFIGMRSDTLVYCAIANWTDGTELTDRVMQDMRSIGDAVRGMC